MRINSSRFGILEISEDKIIKMQKPILGFEGLDSYCLIEQEEFLPFMWLQSLNDPAIAFIVVNPVLFFSDYKIRIHSNEVADMGVESPENVETYVIVTIPQNPKEMSVNLQGPILINTENNRAKQLVMVNSEYQVNHLLFAPEDITKEIQEKRIVDPVGV